VHRRYPGRSHASSRSIDEEFLKPFGLSQNRLALEIGVHPRRVNEIVLEKRSITADTALRLARYFGTSAQFWIGLQSDYELDIAKDVLGNRLEREVRISALADRDESSSYKP
jgi:addiction module HigA family antidote